MKFQVSNLFKKGNGVPVEPTDDSAAKSVPGQLTKLAEAGSQNIAETVVVCPKCKQEFKKAEVKNNLNVCMACGYHYVISAERRVKNLVDQGSFKPLKCKVAFANPLDYPEYEEKIKSLQEKTGLEEAVYTGVGKIEGYEAVIAVMSSKFLMGSMGIAVGEKVTNEI